MNCQSRAILHGLLPSVVHVRFLSERPKEMRKTIIAMTMLVALGLLTVRPSGLFAQGIFYQSATLGAPTAGGFSMGTGQYLGSRFAVTSSVTIGAIGGHIENSAPSQYFGAILSFPGLLPGAGGTNALNGSGTTIVAQVSFSVTDVPSGDVIVPLSSPITLDPSSNTYALVFGSGLSGTNFNGAMPSDNSDTPEGTGSFFFASISGDGSYSWHNGGIDQTRFVLYISAVPEPSTVILSSIGAVGFGGVVYTKIRARRRRRLRVKPKKAVQLSMSTRD